MRDRLRLVPHGGARRHPFTGLLKGGIDATTWQQRRRRFYLDSAGSASLHRFHGFHSYNSLPQRLLTPCVLSVLLSPPLYVNSKCVTVLFDARSALRRNVLPTERACVTCAILSCSRGTRFASDVWTVVRLFPARQPSESYLMWLTEPPRHSQRTL